MNIKGNKNTLALMGLLIIILLIYLIYYINRVYLQRNYYKNKNN